jgi:predicted RNA-binding protein with PUA-like domain
MKYWLFKSEPSCFGIDDLANCPNQATGWDGVRNYQARNMMRDQMQIGDQGFFYHSNCAQVGIAGLIEVVKTAHPDPTQFDPEADHYDPTSTMENPRWYMVDVKLIKKFPRVLTLAEMKKNPLLSSLIILRKGNRLSITPVTSREHKDILCIADVESVESIMKKLRGGRYEAL